MTRQPHGTRARFAAGCACLPCRAANADYNRARIPTAWAHPLMIRHVKQHIATLRAAGLGMRQIAARSGIGRTRLNEIVRGIGYNRSRPAKRKLKVETANAILAVTVVGPTPGGSLVDAEPTWRLLDEMLDAGYSKAAIARALGYATPALQFRRDRITAASARRIAELHARLGEGVEQVC